MDGGGVGGRGGRGCEEIHEPIRSWTSPKLVSWLQRQPSHLSALARLFKEEGIDGQQLEDIYAQPKLWAELVGDPRAAQQLAAALEASTQVYFDDKLEELPIWQKDEGAREPDQTMAEEDRQRRRRGPCSGSKSGAAHHLTGR